MASKQSAVEPLSAVGKKTVAWSPAAGSPRPGRLPRQLTGRRARGSQFNQAWTDAKEQWSKRCKAGKLTAAGGKDINQIIDGFIQSYDVSSPEEFNTRKRAGDAIKDTLACVQLIGGLVAQGASMVFPPANMCFSAVSFLIDAPKRRSKVYEELGQLFVQIATAIMSFKIYQKMEQYTDEMDPQLVETANKILLKIVDVCLLAVEMTESRWDRIKKGLKIALLDNDSGVQTALRDFQNLCHRMTNITQAVTLSEVLGSRDDLRGLRDHLFKQHEVLSDLKVGINDAIQLIRTDQTDRKSERAVIDRRDKIAKKLSVHRKVTDVVDQMVRKLTDASFTFVGEESSKWFFDGPDFKAWCTATEKKSGVLALEGPPRSGKTVLCSSVLRRWPKNADGTSGLPCFAYYAFEKKDKKSSKNSLNDRELVCLALKCMAVQLANRNVEYAKMLADDSEDKSEDYYSDTDMRDLWKKLKFSWAEKDSKNNFVLIFDGLDQLAESAQKDCLKWLANSKIFGTKEPWFEGPKVLITGDIDTFPKSRQIKTVSIQDNNIEDLKFFIARSLQKRETFIGDDEELKRAVKQIKEHLPKQAEGSFGAAEDRLELVQKAIEADYSLKLIRQIVKDPYYSVTFENDQANSAEWQTERSVIERLNRELNEQSIIELNELLIWTSCAEENLTVEELKAAWFLKFKRIPVQSLKNKLQGKYKDIFYADLPDLIGMRSNIKDYLSRNSHINSDRSNFGALNSAKIHLTITVEQGNAAKTKRFVWNLQDPQEITNIGISGLVGQTIDNKLPIETNDLTSHLVLAQRCLALLRDRPRWRTKVLLWYAKQYLPRHLRYVYDYKDQYDTASLLSIAKGLIDLLADVGVTEEHWEATGALADTWLENYANLNTVRQWLRDPKLRKELDPKERRWVEDEANENRSGHACFWKPITLMVAKKWLCGREDPGVLELYRWIDSFVRLTNRQLPYDVEFFYENLERDEDSSDGDSDVSSRERIVIDRLGSQSRTRSRSPSLRMSPNTSRSRTNSKSSVMNDERLLNDKVEDDSESEYNPIRWRVMQAAEWVKQNLECEEDGIWYERLGWTLLSLNDPEAALKTLQKAQEVGNTHWNVKDGIAHAHLALAGLDPEREKEAIKMMEEAVAEMENADRYLDYDKLAEKFLTLGKWNNELKNFDVAKNHFERSISLDSEHMESRWGLIQNCCDADDILGARELLETWTNEDLENELSVLDSLVLWMSLARGGALYFDRLLTLFKDAETLDILRSSLQEAVNSVQDDTDNNSQVKLMFLHLFRGKAATYRNSDPVRRQEALDIWNICQQIAADDPVGIMFRAEAQVSACMAMCHFDMARTAAKLEKEYKIHLEWLRTDHTYYRSLKGNNYLGSLYADIGDEDSAFDIFEDDVRDALTILQDDDPWNDEFAFDVLFQVFLHLNMESDALTAWIMRGNFEHLYEGERFRDEGTFEEGYRSDEEIIIRRHSNDEIRIRRDSDYESDEEVIISREGNREEIIVRRRGDQERSDGEKRGIKEGDKCKKDNEGGAEEKRDNDSSMAPQPASPEVSIKRTKPVFISVACAGICGNSWTFADETWACRFCLTTYFCRSCKEAVRTSSLPKYVCSPDHEWMEIPAMTAEEYEQLDRLSVEEADSKPSATTDENQVRKHLLMDIKVFDGKRVGMPASLNQWLNHIREEFELDSSNNPIMTPRPDGIGLNTVEEESEQMGSNEVVIKLGRPSVSSIHSHPSLKSPTSQFQTFGFR